MDRYVLHEPGQSARTSRFWAAGPQNGGDCRRFRGLSTAMICDGFDLGEAQNWARSLQVNDMILAVQAPIPAPRQFVSIGTYWSNLTYSRVDWDPDRKIAYGSIPVVLRLGTKPTGISAISFIDLISTAETSFVTALATYAVFPSGVSVNHAAPIPPR